MEISLHLLRAVFSRIHKEKDRQKYRQLSKKVGQKSKEGKNAY